VINLLIINKKANISEGKEMENMRTTIIIIRTTIRSRRREKIERVVVLEKKNK
jgi:hypothetical protein